MTLFRKVFQSQSRPATEDEQIDEDALRAAFTEMDAAGHPMTLDPFAQSAPDGAENRDTFEPATEDQSVLAMELMEDDVSVADDQEVYDEDTFVQMPEADKEHYEAARTQTGDVARSDADIAAQIDRALATDVPTEGAVTGGGAHVDVAEWAAPAPDAVTPSHEMGFAAQADSAVSEASSVTPDDMRMLQIVAEAHGAMETEPTGSGANTQDTGTGMRAATQTAALPGQDGADGRASDPQAAHAPAQASLDASPATPDLAAQPRAPEDAAMTLDLSDAAALSAVPPPASGRASRRANRAKTRLLGFNRGAENDADPFEQTAETTATAQRERFPVGWLVIVEGPGMGHAFSLFTGASMIGRGEDQVIRLDFGDNAISRQNHAAIAYDEEQNKFFLGHGGKSNIIRRNARPVLSTEELHHADLIRIGETTLRFVALCGSDFQWHQTEAGDDAPI